MSTALGSGLHAQLWDLQSFQMEWLLGVHVNPGICCCFLGAVLSSPLPIARCQHAMQSQGRSWPPGGLEGLLFCPCHNCSLPRLQNNLMEGLQNGSSQPWSLLLSSCELTKLIVRAGLARLRVAAALYPWGILS